MHRFWRLGFGHLLRTECCVSPEFIEILNLKVMVLRQLSHEGRAIMNEINTLIIKERPQRAF